MRASSLGRSLVGQACIARMCLKVDLRDSFPGKVKPRTRKKSENQHQMNLREAFDCIWRNRQMESSVIGNILFWWHSIENAYGSLCIGRNDLASRAQTHMQPSGRVALSQCRSRLTLVFVRVAFIAVLFLLRRQQNRSAVGELLWLDMMTAVVLRCCTTWYSGTLSPHPPCPIGFLLTLAKPSMLPSLIRGGCESAPRPNDEA